MVKSWTLPVCTKCFLFSTDSNLYLYLYSLNSCSDSVDNIVEGDTMGDMIGPMDTGVPIEVPMGTRGPSNLATDCFMLNFLGLDFGLYL